MNLIRTLTPLIAGFATSLSDLALGYSVLFLGMMWPSSPKRGPASAHWELASKSYLLGIFVTIRRGIVDAKLLPGRMLQFLTPLALLLVVFQGCCPVPISQRPYTGKKEDKPGVRDLKQIQNNMHQVLGEDELEKQTTEGIAGVKGEYAGILPRAIT